MKRYLFATLVMFFGCVSADAVPSHPQDFSGDKHAQLENEGKHFGGRHPAEKKGGRRYGHHHGKHFGDGKYKHSGERPDGKSSSDNMKGKGRNDFHREKWKKPFPPTDKPVKWGRYGYRHNSR